MIPVLTGDLALPTEANLPQVAGLSRRQHVLSWSYRALTPDAARLFRLLGLHPGPDLTTPVAASLAGLPDRR